MPAKTKRSTRRPSPSRHREALARGVTERGPDDGHRGTLGVLASLVTRSDGTVRLVLEDVRHEENGTWKPLTFFTSRTYPAAILGRKRIAPGELERTGLVVLTRLLALEKAEPRGG